MERKQIDGYEGLYSITITGEVFSEERVVLRAGRQLRVHACQLRQLLSNHGYFTVMLSKVGVRARCCVHRLIADAWLPRIDGQCREVNHKNGVKTDNRIDNLEWVTTAGNSKHAYENGLKLPTRKLSDSQVEVVRSRLMRGDVQRQIAEDLGISKSQISAIALGKIYRRPMSEIMARRAQIGKAA